MELHAVLFQKSINSTQKLIENCDFNNLELKIFQIDTFLATNNKIKTEVKWITYFLKSNNILERSIICAYDGLVINIG